MALTTLSGGKKQAGAEGGEDGWTTLIEPRTAWLDWRLLELWGSRDLISMLVWRDFVAYYKQTILGPLWHVIQPLLTTLTFTLIFGSVARLPTNGAPPFLFYLAGNVLWAYFSTCLTKTSSMFVANSALLGKVYFHRMVIPISSVLSALIAFGIQFGMFAGFVAWHSFRHELIPLRPTALLLPLIILMLAGFGLAGGIIVSAMTTRYRDLTHVVGFGVQLLMYATPVIYPISALPDKYRWIALANPLSPLMELFRHGFLGGPPISFGTLAYSAICLLVILLSGMALFTRVERTFMDTV